MARADAVIDAGNAPEGGIQSSIGSPAIARAIRAWVSVGAKASMKA
jgi:hypothetical protein